MITSMINSRIRHVLLLQEKSRARSKEGLFVTEGVRMFEEVPEEVLKEIYCSESFYLSLTEKKDDNPHRERVYQKLCRCGELGIPVELVSGEVFRKISDTKTPQGILFVVKSGSCSLKEMIVQAEKKKQEQGREPLFLILEDIQDPGNLGTMMRTAEGAGADGVIMSKGTVDIYNPKTIRATMGSLYRVPFVCMENLEEAVSLLKKSGITTYAAHLKGEKFFHQIRYSGGSAFLIGNEGNGLKTETAQLADTYLKIPMEGKLESLNASVAAALLLYQAAGSTGRFTLGQEK